MNKFLFLIIIYTFSISSLANCRYQYVQQGEKFFIIKKVEGELLDKEEEIKVPLNMGINDVKITHKKNKAQKPRESRIKVRLEVDSKEEAENFLSTRCSD